MESRLKGKLVCGICGNEVDEKGITFIETDYGICEECLKTLNEGVEEEIESKGERNELS